MKLTLGLLLSAFTASLHATSTIADHAMTCQNDTLKFDFVEQQGVFTMSSPDQNVQILGCGYVKISQNNTTALHCSASTQNVRYDIYPQVMTDDSIKGASVIAWSNDGAVTDLAPLTCATTK